ncbi:tyrosine-type recombinase/integrase [Pseudoalteromonas sp. SS15]|uniref:tyrosine-type recombinase/integrase n=1 Tax=Pseudoalteromonas sp. SS15 TaxID=3139393 RepID=UPI003BAD3F04
MYAFNSEKFKSTLYCNELGVPYLLPCLFSQHLHENKEGYKISWIGNLDKKSRKKAELTNIHLADTTIKSICSELKKFIVWYEEYSQDKNAIKMKFHHNAPDELLEHYINEVLVVDLCKSEKMVEKALSAIRYYYNFLAYNGISHLKTIDFTKKARVIAKDNTQTRNAIKYISTNMRATIYNSADTIRDECLLKNSGECGLRTKENTGILLNDFKVGKMTYQGVKSFFDKIDWEESQNLQVEQLQQEFKYRLQGKYTKGKKSKGGRARWIYIKRDLMLRYKAYYQTERPTSNSNTLFVTNKGHPIGTYQGTRAFTKARKIVLEKQDKGLLPEYFDILEDEHTYHCLRHSFGTDKFYDACIKNGLNFETVSYTHQPYRLVAELLGHTSEKPDVQSQTTSMYIHFCFDKLATEEKVNSSLVLVG